MQLIPVLDLMDGVAVRAVRGARAAYRPLVSRLAPGHDPATLAAAMCRHAAARTLYVADLDAIVHGRPQPRALAAILAALPGATLWLDAGFADAAAADALRATLGADAARVVPVFGSESLRSADALARCFASSDAAVLSLDRRDGRRLDPAGAWDAPAAWPRRVIAMTLEQVGSDAGPDLATLRGLRERAPRAALYGAGGIRDAADLAAARAAGAAGWLVASALHDGRLPAARDGGDGIGMTGDASRFVPSPGAGPGPGPG